MMKTKLLLMLLAAMALVAPAAQANMLSNPGFEEGTFATQRIPSYWYMSSPTYTSAWSWFDDADGAHGGSRYIKMVSYTSYGSSAWMWQTVDVTAGQEYAFGVWAKSPVEGKVKEAWGYYEWTEPNETNESGYRVISGDYLGYWDWVGDDWEQAYFGWQVVPAGATHCIFSLVGAVENGDDGILFDDAYMTDKFAKLISPKEIVGYAPYDAVLSWTNMDPNTPDDPNNPDDPNTPDDPVYVDVWFGADSNDLDTKVVTAGEDVETWTESELPVGSYFWRVDSYIEGSATGDPIEGFVWSFKVTDDFAPSVDAGTDIITWSGESVTLDPNIVDDGHSLLTYHWTADIPQVVFDPNEFVLAPTVTIIPDPNIIWIVNAGFEHPPLADGDGATSSGVNGWTEGYYGWASFSWHVDGDVQGVVNPDTKYGYGGVAAEGRNIAEVISTGDRGGLEQVLSVNAKANTTYTLSFKVGSPDLMQLKGSYAVELMAGPNPMFIIENSVPLIRNEWVSVSRIFRLDGTDPSDPNYARVGKPLKIRLVQDDASDVNFDSIRLTSTSDTVSPDAAGVNLTLNVSDKDPHALYPTGDTVTIDVYRDECMAARGANQQPETDTDIVVDCITEIKDLAEMVETWLDDNSIAAQHKADRLIYYDDFSGDGSISLNGTAPDMRPGVEHWISNEYIMDDGTRPLPPGDPHVSAVIPFAPLADNVYQLSATIDADGKGGWMALGFTEEASIRSWVAAEMMAVGYIRQGTPYDNINTYLGPINEEGHDFTYPTSEEPYDVMVELDTNPDPWTLEWFAAPAGEPLVSLRGPTAYTYTPLISHVGIAFFGEAEGTFDDFRLHEGPIPGTGPVDAGSSWNASKGESITIDDASVDQPPLAYAWTATDPNTAADVDITYPATLTPTVTFTGSTTDNPTIIELELYATYSDSDPNLNASDTTKIYIYDDSCKVGLGAGQKLDPGDVDQDCDTDLKDFAAVAEVWLEEYALDEPVAKIPVISTDKASYDPNETIIFSYMFAEGNDLDWIGVFDAGAANDSELYHIIYYLEGEIHGSIVEDDPQLPVGSYEARMFFDDSYNLEAVTSFEVE